MSTSVSSLIESIEVATNKHKPKGKRKRRATQNGLKFCAPGQKKGTPSTPTPIRPLDHSVLVSQNTPVANKNSASAGSTQKIPKKTTKTNVVTVKKTPVSTTKITLPAIKTTLIAPAKVIPAKATKIARATSAQTTPLAKIVDGDQSLQAAARADKIGVLSESYGDAELDGVSVAVAMCADHMGRLEKLLGMGSVRGWCSVAKTSSLFVQPTEESSAFAVGKTSNDPPRVLEKMVTLLGK